MKSIYLFIAMFIALIINVESTQAQDCDGVRYLDNITETTEKVTVKYGENYTFDNNFQELYMDIYTPTGDTYMNRGTLVFAFGGSFIGGDKADVAEYCEYFAKKGYTSVAIDYRIYDKEISFVDLPDSTDMLDVVMKAVGDMKAAVRFLRKTVDDGNPYGINPDHIFTGGISAGGITAVHAAYVSDLEALPDYVQTAVMANGGIEGDTDLPNDSYAAYNSYPAGVISLAGGMHRKEWIADDAMPLCSIHGDDDGTVPYGYGSAMVVIIPIITMDGSSKLHERMDDLNIYNEFITVPGGGHLEYMSTSWGDSILTTSSVFMQAIMCGTASDVELIDLSQNISVFPNPAQEKIEIAMNNIDQMAYNVELYDAMGRLVQSHNGADNQLTIERDDLVRGTYFLSIRFEDERYAPVNKKVVFF